MKSETETETVRLWDNGDQIGIAQGSEIIWSALNDGQTPQQAVLRLTEFFPWAMSEPPIPPAAWQYVAAAQSVIDDGGPDAIAFATEIIGIVSDPNWCAIRQPPELFIDPRPPSDLLVEEIRRLPEFNPEPWIYTMNGGGNVPPVDTSIANGGNGRGVLFWLFAIGVVWAVIKN